MKKDVSIEKRFYYIFNSTTTIRYWMADLIFDHWFPRRKNRLRKEFNLVLDLEWEGGGGGGKKEKRKKKCDWRERVVMFLQRARESSIAFIVLRKSMLEEAVLFLIFNSFIIERLSRGARFLSLKKFFIHHLRISLRLHILFLITA